MIIGFGNNVVSSLAADITAGQTTIQVMPGAGAIFEGLLSQDYTNSSNTPKIYAKITLTDAKETVFEVCHLTAVNNDMLTVVRGQEGTTAKGWALNDVIANFATRGSENQFVQIEQLQSGHYTSGVAGGSANALTISLPASYFVNGSTDWTLRTPLVIYPSQNNTGASTLQLTMGGRVLGTYPLYKGNKAALVANDILKDVALVCLMDNTKSFFTILNPGGIYSSFVPISRKVNGHALDKDTNVTSQDIFNGQAIGLSTEDLDTLKTPGIYYQPANANTSAARHYPETNAGTLLVYKNAGVTQVYIVYNSSRTYTRSQYSTGAWTAWAKQYDTANKPSPSDIGAVNKSGDTMSGTLKVGAEVQTTSANSYRMVYGNYGAFWRQDGSNLYLMLTNSGEQYGSYNSLRPLAVNLSSGDVTMGKLNLTNFQYFDARYYTKTQTDAGYMPKTGAYTKAESDGRFQPKGSYTPAGQAYTKAESDARYQKINSASKAANGWYKDANTGMIFQWGVVSSSVTGNVNITFPTAFPSACVNVQNTIIRKVNDGAQNNWTYVTSFTKTGASVGCDGHGVYWFAVGY